jgi:hypothetical protein
MIIVNLLEALYKNTTHLKQIFFTQTIFTHVEEYLFSILFFSYNIPIQIICKYRVFFCMYLQRITLNELELCFVHKLVLFEYRG